MSSLSGFGQIVYEDSEEALEKTPKFIKSNYDKGNYSAVAGVLKRAIWHAIMMAMSNYTATKDAELSKSDLIKGQPFVEELLNLCKEVANMQIDIGFEISQTLMYCMLVKDQKRLDALASILDSEDIGFEGSEDLKCLGSMLKAYVRDDLIQFQENYEKFRHKKSRPTGYDREIDLCLSVLQRDQAKFDEILNEIELDYPKRKKSRSWQNTQAIFGGGDYNEIFFDFTATAIASYAKKLGMQVKPKSDVAVPEAFL